jgi:hypothetical protein
MKLRFLLLSGMAAGLVASAAQAQTAPPLPISQRDSAYTIIFPSGLDSAVTSYEVTATLPSGAADPGASTLSYKTGFYNFTAGTTGTVGSTYPVPPATNPQPGALTNGGSGGTYSFGYDTNNGPDFSSSWTVSTTDLGHHVLAFGGIGSQGFGGCGSNFLSIGGLFTCEVLIQGVHAIGTGPGDVELTNLSSNFNVVQDFVPSGGDTLLAVSSANWNGTNPDLGFDIFGAAVPEPATWAMLLFGLGAVGAGLRLHRRANLSLA